MKITQELLELLGQIGNPNSILDVGCADGSFVYYLSKRYINSTVYGLDINRELLAIGIAKGHFEKAFPVQGDARMLTKEKPIFPIVSLKKEAYSKGLVNWAELKEDRKIELKNFDFVTAFNPYNRLSSEEVNSLMKGQRLKDRLITVDVVSKAAKIGGFILYGREIAHRLGKIYGSEAPNNVSKKNIDANLEILLSEGKGDNLVYVSHCLIADNDSANITILFNKAGAG
jgi:SAM-dependent methyltransferase